MASLSALDLYGKFGNFFKLKCKVSKVYEFELKPGEEIAREKVIFFEGKHYSYEYRNGATELEPNLQILKRIVTKQFGLKLREKRYRFKGKYRAYTMEDEVKQSHTDVFSIFDGFEYRIVILEDSLFLCVDPHLVLRTNCSIKYLYEAGLDVDELSDFPVSYRDNEGYRVAGYLIETKLRGSGLNCLIKRYREPREQEVVSSVGVFPESRPELIQKILENLDRRYNVIALQRRLSFLDSKTASKDRLTKTLDIVKKLKKEIFPLEFGEFTVNLETEPIVIRG